MAGPEGGARKAQDLQGLQGIRCCVFCSRGGLDQLQGALHRLCRQAQLALHLALLQPCVRLLGYLRLCCLSPAAQPAWSQLSSQAEPCGQTARPRQLHSSCVQ